MSFFFNNRPRPTCSSESCTECPISNSLHCHVTVSNTLYYVIIAAPVLIIGGQGIWVYGPWFFILWGIILLGFFGLVEIPIIRLIMKKSSPTFWKYRPGTMSFKDKLLFSISFICIWLYPVYFLVAQQLWFFLLLYGTTFTAFFLTMRRWFCPHCVNFSCPLNAVPLKLRKEFFKENPKIYLEWHKGHQQEQSTSL